MFLQKLVLSTLYPSLAEERTTLCLLLCFGPAPMPRTALRSPKHSSPVTPRRKPQFSPSTTARADSAPRRTGTRTSLFCPHVVFSPQMYETPPTPSSSTQAEAKAPAETSRQAPPRPKTGVGLRTIFG